MTGRMHDTRIDQGCEDCRRLRLAYHGVTAEYASASTKLQRAALSRKIPNVAWLASNLEVLRIEKAAVRDAICRHDQATGHHGPAIPDAVALHV